MAADEPTRRQPEARGPGDPAAGDFPRRLFRSRDSRLIAGVAGGLARYFAIDPIIVRIAFAALALFGGAGVFLYLAGVLFVPDEGAPGEPAGSSIAGGGRLATALGAGVLAVAALALIGETVFFFPGPPVVLAVTAIALYAMLRPDDGAPPSARRVATRIGIGVAILVASFAGLVLSAWASGMGYGAVVAAAVILLGLLLVAGAVTRRREARWLVLPALVLAVPLAVVSAADVDLRGGFGERIFRPTSAAQVPAAGYRLGAGHMEIDLRGVDFAAGPRSLDVGLGMGEAVVVVPRNVCVETRATVGAGMAHAFGNADGGADVRMADAAPSPPGVPRLVINADLGMGELQVVNDPADARGHRGRDRSGRDGDGHGGRNGGPSSDEDDGRGSDGNGPPWAEGDGPPWVEDDGPPWDEDEDRAADPEAQGNTACGPVTAQVPGDDR